MNELLWYLHERVIPDALHLLPAKMTSREAQAMMLAIGLQESAFQHRRQMGNGPARGFWQFEKNGGVKGILDHPVTGPLVKPICKLLCYKPTPEICHTAIEHNDVLAAVFARLLIWVDPRSLPSPIETDKGWSIYVENWRPGKPHPSIWPACFELAWSTVKGS
jgi:hypothetical protein